MRLSWAMTGLLLGVAASAFAAERHMMPPRVPAEKLAEARALENPLPDTAEIADKGKVLYHGKGTCVNCHGAEGNGSGPLAASLDPSPRNFQHHGFWRHRTDGELFWVIKHGSPGTAMIGFAGQLSDEEIWQIIHYERTFAGAHGPGRGRGPRHGMESMRHPDERGCGPGDDRGHCKRSE